MKKKILALVMFTVISLSCVACGSASTYQEAIGENYGMSDMSGGYFNTIVEWDGSAPHSYKIVYANDTKVKYLIVVSGYKFGITPLYNADGTLQIYDGR